MDGNNLRRTSYATEQIITIMFYIILNETNLVY